MLIGQAPTPEIPKLPADTPPAIQAVVYGSVAVILIVAAAGRYIGARAKGDAKATDATAPSPSNAGPVAAQAEASQALMERLVAGLEKRLDEALATQQTIQRRYETEIDELRDELATTQREKWELSSQLRALHLQLEDARVEVIQLRAELQAARPGPDWRQR